MKERVTVGLQEAISGGRTHGEEKAAIFLTELKMPILFQHFNDTWQERDQAFGADPVERLPGQHQGLFGLWSIPPTEISGSLEDPLRMVEQPPGIFACVPCRAHKVFQDLLLLGCKCSVIRRRNRPGARLAGLVSSIRFPRVPPVPDSQPEITCDRFPSAASRPSPFCQEYSA